MANVTTNNLPQAALPVSGNDILILSRDGVVVSQIKLSDLLVGFVPTVNIATPNTTVPVEAFVATGASGNIDVALVPKGTGAFSLHIADGLVTGGNKRGANAVDLQTSRTAATQVASGTGSFVAGQNNTSTGQTSFAVGSSNTSANISTFCAGDGNSATGQVSICLGSQNSASGLTAFSIGRLNTASGDRSFAFGISGVASGLASGAFGSFTTTNGIQGQVAFGHNSNLLGGYQTTLTGLRIVTTGTTATRITADGASAATTNQLTLRNNSVFKFQGRVVAYDMTTLDAKEWDFSGLIKRGAAAANTSLVGTPSITSAFADTAAAAWTISIAADTTNGALAVNVQGAGANQIRWYVEIFSFETGF